MSGNIWYSAFDAEYEAQQTAKERVYKPGKIFSIRVYNKTWHKKMHLTALMIAEKEFRFFESTEQAEAARVLRGLEEPKITGV